jgi:hypothetical protein
MRINRHGAKARDPLTRKYYTLPEESSGLLMVFRTFEKASYALVMTGNRSVNIGDVLVTP